MSSARAQLLGHEALYKLVTPHKGKKLWDFNKPKGISICGVHGVRVLHRCPEGSTFQVMYVVTNMFSAELTRTHVDPSNSVR